MRVTRPHVAARCPRGLLARLSRSVALSMLPRRGPEDNRLCRVRVSSVLLPRPFPCSLDSAALPQRLRTPFASVPDSCFNEETNFQVDRKRRCGRKGTACRWPAAQGAPLAGPGSPAASPGPAQQASGRQGPWGRDPLCFWVCELDFAVQAAAGVGVRLPCCGLNVDRGSVHRPGWCPRGGVSCCWVPRAIFERVALDAVAGWKGRGRRSVPVGPSLL